MVTRVLENFSTTHPTRAESQKSVVFFTTHHHHFHSRDTSTNSTVISTHFQADPNKLPNLHHDPNENRNNFAVNPFVPENVSLPLIGLSPSIPQSVIAQAVQFGFSNTNGTYQQGFSGNHPGGFSGHQSAKRINRQPESIIQSHNRVNQFSVGLSNQGSYTPEFAGNSGQAFFSQGSPKQFSNGGQISVGRFEPTAFPLQPSYDGFIQTGAARSPCPCTSGSGYVTIGNSRNPIYSGGSYGKLNGFTIGANQAIYSHSDFVKQISEPIDQSHGIKFIGQYGQNPENAYVQHFGRGVFQYGNSPFTVHQGYSPTQNFNFEPFIGNTGMKHAGYSGPESARNQAQPPYVSGQMYQAPSPFFPQNISPVRMTPVPTGFTAAPPSFFPSTLTGFTAAPTPQSGASGHNGMTSGFQLPLGYYVTFQVGPGAFGSPYAGFGPGGTPVKQNAGNPGSRAPLNSMADTAPVNAVGLNVPGQSTKQPYSAGNTFAVQQFQKPYGPIVFDTVAVQPQDPLRQQYSNGNDQNRYGYQDYISTLIGSLRVPGTSQASRGISANQNGQHDPIRDPAANPQFVATASYGNQKAGQRLPVVSANQNMARGPQSWFGSSKHADGSQAMTGNLPNGPTSGSINGLQFDRRPLNGPSSLESGSTEPPSPTFGKTSGETFSQNLVNTITAQSNVDFPGSSQMGNRFLTMGQNPNKQASGINPMFLQSSKFGPAVNNVRTQPPNSGSIQKTEQNSLQVASNTLSNLPQNSGFFDNKLTSLAKVDETRSKSSLAGSPDTMLERQQFFGVTAGYHSLQMSSSVEVQQQQVTQQTAPPTQSGPLDSTVLHHPSDYMVASANLSFQNAPDTTPAVASGSLASLAANIKAQLGLTKAPVGPQRTAKPSGKHAFSPFPMVSSELTTFQAKPLSHMAGEIASNVSQNPLYHFPQLGAPIAHPEKGGSRPRTSSSAPLDSVWPAPNLKRDGDWSLFPWNTTSFQQKAPSGTLPLPQKETGQFEAKDGLSWSNKSSQNTALFIQTTTSSVTKMAE